MFFPHVGNSASHIPNFDNNCYENIFHDLFFGVY